MPAKDLIHDSVRDALKNDGWAITHEQTKLEFEDAHIYIDLGAERMLLAERANEKIAVEVKSFISRSVMQDVEDALGQFVVYRIFLRRVDPDRHLFVGISHLVFNTVFQSKAIQVLVEELGISLLVVDVATKEVLQWLRK